MATNYISLKKVADSLLRHPMMEGISFEAIIDYTIDFMRIVQCYGFFGEEVATIEIENYKGKLPDDFFEINQVRLTKTTANILTPKYTKTKKGDLILATDYCSTTIDAPIHNGTFNNSTDTFFMSDKKHNVGLTYKIQGGYIFTSIKEGEIEISYQSILIDDDLYPMIPDNSKFTRALEAYIKKQWFTILFDMGKLQPAILQNIQQEYAWAVGACESEFQKMSLDKAESFYNSWRTMIPREYQHSRNFSYIGSKQNLNFD